MVMFLILMTISLAFITFDRHQSKEKYMQFEEEDQVSDSEIEAEDAKWKSITGLALIIVCDPDKQSMKFDDLRLVADTALWCIKCVPNISCL